MRRMTLVFIVVIIAIGFLVFYLLLCQFNRKVLSPEKPFAQEKPKKSLILIAAKEEAASYIPCTLWKLNGNTTSFTKLHEFTDSYVSTITYYPDDNLLVIWGSEKSSKNGLIQCVATDSSLKYSTISLPFYPTFLGHFIRKKNGKRLIHIDTDDTIRKDLKQEEPFYIIDIDTLERTKSTEFSLAEVSIPGYTWLRDYEGNFAYARYHTTVDDNGKIYFQSGGTIFASDMVISKDIFQLLGDEPTARLGGQILSNTDYFIMRSSHKKAEKYRPAILKYDKKKQKWSVTINGEVVYSDDLGNKQITIPGFLPNATFGQLFGNWYAMQEGFFEYTEIEKGRQKANMVITGYYSFYNLKTDKYFMHYFGEPGERQNYPVKISDEVFVKFNEATMAPEVLLISEGKIYYRQGNILYEADFSENGLKNPKELVKDNIISLVHWAFLSEIP
ncbi:MAG: hypothetical protein HZA48_12170 [Planctomycetes bacterium]|nr:hypothetical protein [Planctomycetota bacterium]